MAGHRHHWLRVFACVALVASLAGAAVAASERIVGDWRTGLAIYGFDPVAYFVDSKAVAGRAELELVHAGATWRFSNPGNLSAFKSDPEVYAPQFGGYDPLGVGRGVATPGHPEFWVVFNRHLLLFHSAETRAAFLESPERLMEVASAKWPEVVARLVP